MTCDFDWLQRIYEVSMYTSDWDNIEFYYEEIDAGSVTNTTVKDNCREDPDDAEITICDITIGWIPDYEDRGLSQALQQKAGFINKSGDYGLISVNGRWEFL